MYFLIFENQISGTSEEIVDPPLGFLIVEGIDLPIEQVYFNGVEVLEKPPQPTPEHFWDVSQNAWILLPELEIQIKPDWDKLITLLQNSPEWGRTYTSAERTLKANTAFTTLLTTLTTLRKVETLQFALAKLREAMSAISGLGDFSAEEITSINQKLTECGFELQLNV